jgi:tetratricopeptide (TPR) repeat protein
MKLSQLLIEIQQTLQAGDAARVMTALRQDDLVWYEVQTNDLFSKLSAFMPQMDAWRPAFLSLLALGLDANAVDTFLKDPLAAPEEGLRNQAFQLYELTLRNGSSMQPEALAEAGLLALALREQGRMSGTWDGLGKDLHLDQPGSLDSWKTAFACLYGMVPDPEKMLQALMKEIHFQNAVEIISNAILSNPQMPPERVAAFTALLDELPIANQLGWLRSLNLKGQNELIIQLADRLLQTGLTNQLSLGEVDLENMDMNTLLHGAVSFQQLAGLFQLSGQPEKALPLLKRSQKAVQHYLAGVNLQLLDVGAGEESSETIVSAFKQSFAALPESKILQTEYALAVDNSPHAKTLKKQFTLNVENPFIEIQNAAQALEEGDRVKAEMMARGAVTGLVDWMEKENPFVATQFLFSWQPDHFMQTLVDLDLPAEALKAVQMFLRVRPNDSALIDLASHLYDQVGDSEEALNYNLMGLTFDANNFKAHRRVAELLEEQNEFRSAMDHRRKVLDLDGDAQTNDWLSFAKCAFQAEDLLQVVDACNKVVEVEAQNPEANTLMGQSLYRLGDKEAAVVYLSQATVLSPSISKNWLMLSDIYRQNNDQPRLFETLRLAILSNPESAEINYELAQTCLEQGKLADALPFLRKAASLAPESVRLAMQLGETLKSLGHLPEARQALEKARQKFPTDANLALLLARTLMSMGEARAALPALEVVLQMGNPGFDEYMMYLKALLGDQLFPIISVSTDQDLVRLINAQQALDKALAIKPDDFNARVLKAEILAAKGDRIDAFECYQGLIDHPNATIPEWQGRIYGGFGKVALDLKEIETALAVLKEASHAQPENVYLQRMLSEAYLTADLKDEAYQVAQNALKLAPTNLQNLAWFADMALKLNDETEAISALNCIVELDPDSAENWVKLADTQLKLGRIEDVRKTLKSLLNLDQLSVEHWRQAAYIFLRLNDQVSALSCLEQAIILSPERASELNFELACLQKSLGHFEPALGSLQKAIEQSPKERVLYVMQADLMAGLGRSQAAMACLEQALNLEKTTADAGLEPHENGLGQSMKLLPARWLEIASSNAGIHARFAYILRHMGNLQDAMEHAEKAVNADPEMLSYRYQAVDLANSLLYREKASHMLEWLEAPEHPDGLGTLKTIEGKNPDVWLSLASQWAEQALDSDEEILAGRIVQQLIGLAQDAARVLGGQVRMLARQGQTQIADEVTAKLMQTVQIDRPSPDKMIEDYSGMELVSDCLKGRPFWLANALLDANHFNEALDLFEKSAYSSTDALGNLEFARALVKVAEKQRLMKELKCFAHLPGVKTLSEENAAKFEKAANLALNISNSPEAEMWLLRGKAAFYPNPQNIHALDRRLENNGDVAPLVAVLRQTGNIPAALAAAQRLRGLPEDLLQGALCLQDGYPDKGLMLCQRALETRSNNPIFNAATALMSQKAGRDEKALESLELALESWSNEPEWHSWAAHLAKTVAPENKMPHLQRAYDLEPTCVDYAYELGEAHLEAHNPAKTIQILEKSVESATEHPGVWTCLAQAYDQVNRVQDAFRSAETATKLAPSSSSNLLMCGKLALKMGKSDVAVDYANAALDCAPKDEDVVVFASQVYANQGHLQKSLNVIEKSLPNIPDSFKIAYEQVKLTRQMSGSPSSLEMARSLAQKYPNQFEAVTLLAEIEMDLGHLNESKQAALESLKLNDQQPALMLLLGRLMRLSGQLDQAIDYMVESIHLEPTWIEAYLDLGETYQERREPMEALHTYQQGIKVEPNEPVLYYSAALIMRELKDYIGAEAMLRRAAELSPQDLNIRRQLGAVIALNLVHNSQEANSQL